MTAYNMAGARDAYTNFSSGAGIGVVPKPGAALEFFNKIMPSLSKANGTMPPDSSVGSGQSGRFRSDRTFSDMMNGLQSQIFEAVESVLMIEDSWYFEVAPVREADSPTITWHVTTFRPRIPTPTPPHTRVRLLDVFTKQGQQGLTRMGIGMEVDDETLRKNVPRGIDWYLRQLNMMAQSVLEGNKMAIAWGILTAHRNRPIYFSGPNLYKGRTLVDVLDVVGKMAFSVIKNETPFHNWHNRMTNDMRLQGVVQGGAVWILHEHTMKRLSLDKKRYNKFSNNGPAGWQIMMDGPEAWTTFMGAPVYAARSFINTHGEIDLWRRHYTIGLYYAMKDRLRLAPNKVYDPAMRTIAIIDATERCVRAITIKQAREASGRWNIGPNGSGDLNSMQDPDSWSYLDLYHRPKERGPDIWHDPETGDVVPVLGGSSQFTGEDFVASIKSYLFGVKPNRRQKYEDALDTVYEAIEIIERQSINNAAGKALLEELKTAATIVSGDSASKNPWFGAAKNGRRCAALLAIEVARNEHGSMKLGNAFNNAAWELPPFLGNYAGLKTLVALAEVAGNVKNLTKKDKIPLIKIALANIEELARMVKKPFANSYLLDPAYASSDQWKADYPSQIVDALVPARFPLWVSEAVGDVDIGIAEQLTSLTQLSAQLRTFTEAYGTGIITAAAAAAATAAATAAAAAISATTAPAVTKPATFPVQVTDSNGLQKEILLYAALSKISKENVLTEYNNIKNIVGAVASPVEYKDALLSRYSGNAIVSSNINTTWKLLQAITSAPTTVPTGAASAKTTSTAAFFRTPLWVSPQQLKDMATLTKDVNTFTVSTEENRDLAAPLTVAIKYFTKPEESIHGQVLSEQKFLRGKFDLAAVRTMHGIINHMRQKGLQTGLTGILRSLRSTGAGAAGSALAGVARRQQMAPASNIMSILDPGKPQQGASLGGGSISGSRDSAEHSAEVSRYFGCTDPKTIDMVNAAFIAAWNRIADMGNRLLEPLLARALMTTTTNYYKGIEPLEASGVPVKDNYYIMRMLHEEAYPVYRMVPGERTMFLVRMQESMHWNTDPKTAIFGIYMTWYDGVIMPGPENIHHYDGVDPANYLFGMGTNWRDIREHISAPHKDQGNGRDLICMAAPYNTQCDPFVMSPSGEVRLLSGIAEGGVSSIESLSNGTESFENIRMNWSSIRHSRQIKEQSIQGRTMSRELLTPVYYQDTVFMLDMKNLAVWEPVVASLGPLPVTFATPALRNILDGDNIQDIPAMPIIASF